MLVACAAPPPGADDDAVMAAFALAAQLDELEAGVVDPEPVVAGFLADYSDAYKARQKAAQDAARQAKRDAERAAKEAQRARDRAEREAARAARDYAKAVQRQREREVRDSWKAAFRYAAALKKQQEHQAKEAQERADRRLAGELRIAEYEARELERINSMATGSDSSSSLSSDRGANVEFEDGFRRAGDVDEAGIDQRAEAEKQRAAAVKAARAALDARLREMREDLDADTPEKKHALQQRRLEELRKRVKEARANSGAPNRSLANDSMQSTQDQPEPRQSTPAQAPAPAAKKTAKADEPDGDGWEENEHPRGADGRFIKVGGDVYVYANSTSSTPAYGGKVVGIENGMIVVQKADGTKQTVDRKAVRQSARHKARLDASTLRVR